MDLSGVSAGKGVGSGFVFDCSEFPVPLAFFQRLVQSAPQETGLRFADFNHIVAFHNIVYRQSVQKWSSRPVGPFEPARLLDGRRLSGLAKIPRLRFQSLDISHMKNITPHSSQFVPSNLGLAPRSRTTVGILSSFRLPPLPPKPIGHIGADRWTPG